MCLKVVSCSVESPAAVTEVQFLLRKRLILARGGAVNHNQVNLSHSACFFWTFDHGETSGAPTSTPQLLQ